MRNGMLGLLAMALLLLLGSLPLLAQDETTSGSDGTIFGLTIVDGAIVRVGPDFAYREVGSLPRNASVVVTGRAGDFFTRWDGRQWLQIEYGGGSGWIYARLLRTSVPFNSIPPVGRMLPRDRNGRVPDEFDLSTDLCSQWQGEFTQSGDFMAGDSQIVVTYPTLQGATLYSVIAISPTGFRTAFDSETGSATILLDRLPNTPGTYTWRVVPYWANSSFRSSWQQICLLQTGGTFEKPETDFNRAGSR
ncbi:MAG: SH3 domain-containing protein [Anaerolineae bacterium]|nr:SH3 domain-containing protein [Anaerolineae bacterium]